MKGGCKIIMNDGKHTLPQGNEADKARAAKNAYQRQWYKKNPGKAREYRERYWMKRAAQVEQERTAEAGE